MLDRLQNKENYQRQKRHCIMTEKSVYQKDITVLIKPQTFKMHEAKTGISEKRNRQSHSYI